MALSYKLDKRLNFLEGLFDSYQTWFNSIVGVALYGGGSKNMPQALSDWLKTIPFDDIDADGSYARRQEELLKKRDELEKLSQKIKQAPEPKDFAMLTAAFQNFMRDLQSFTQAIALEEWGLDMVTGLKNRFVMHDDLSIEMERLAREGHPFCVGLARIDAFEEAMKSLSVNDLNALVKTVAELIKKSLRSYDDAYRLENGHFVMCIKQSDLTGGQKALMRLRDILEQAQEKYQVDGQTVPLSLSCCVAMPLAGDDIDELITYLYDDLDGQPDDRGSVMTYRELSPLQRFIEGEKGQGAE